MPYGPADDDGTILYYDDTGIPRNSAGGEQTSYVTAVLVHGTMFHGAVFRCLIPYAAASNLRLVMVNLRDYAGSTAYSPEELAGFVSDRGTQTAAIQARGLEFAHFLRWYITKEQIPVINQLPDGKSTGGFALLGWSSGNCQTAAMLAYADLVPEEMRKLLEPYFRSYVFYDPSEVATGTPITVRGLYSPFLDKSLSAAQKAAAFPTWVSSYFTQAALGPDDDSASPTFSALLTQRYAVHLDADGAPLPDVDPRFTPTVRRMAEEGVLEEVMDNGVMERSQIYLHRIEPAVYQENIRCALFEPPSDGERIIWPNVRVHVVWCDMTNSRVAFAANELKRMVRVHKEAGRQGRSVQFHILSKANHFAHWDEPEKFVRFLEEII